jgi:hypothetical protein
MEKFHLDLVRESISPLPHPSRSHRGRIIDSSDDDRCPPRRIQEHMSDDERLPSAEINTVRQRAGIQRPTSREPSPLNSLPLKRSSEQLGSPFSKRMRTASPMNATPGSVLNSSVKSGKFMAGQLGRNADELEYNERREESGSMGLDFTPVSQVEVRTSDHDMDVDTDLAGTIVYTKYANFRLASRRLTCHSRSASLCSAEYPNYSYSSGTKTDTSLLSNLDAILKENRRILA